MISPSWEIFRGSRKMSKVYLPAISRLLKNPVL
jgi:hypothetical protein